jgi:hypothetical protein
MNRFSRYRRGAFFADDEEYSVIPKSFLCACRLVCWAAATWLVWLYFEGALADAPACALSDTSTAPERMASVPAMVAKYLDIAASI